MSAFFTAAGTSSTWNFAAFAFPHEEPPARSPTITDMPLSFRLFAWACPWLPYPRIAIVFPLSSSTLASCSR